MKPAISLARRGLCLSVLGYLCATRLPLSYAQGLMPALELEKYLANWSAKFALEVDHLRAAPADYTLRCIALLESTLALAGLNHPSGQALLLVDRNINIQTALLMVGTQAGGWHCMGACKISTGKTGSYDHFRTPLGVFVHSLENPDYRSEGTYNSKHIRGYGVRGMRVYDFGWQIAERGWGLGGTSAMRLQMHATDPVVLEPRLGRVDSKGCVRIPASLNQFLDKYGVLDAEYALAAAAGDQHWVLDKQGMSLPWMGRYMVVIDSAASSRPAWAV